MSWSVDYGFMMRSEHTNQLVSGWNKACRVGVVGDIQPKKPQNGCRKDTNQHSRGKEEEEEEKEETPPHKQLGPSSHGKVRSVSKQLAWEMRSVSSKEVFYSITVVMSRCCRE